MSLHYGATDIEASYIQYNFIVPRGLNFFILYDWNMYYSWPWFSRPAVFLDWDKCRSSYLPIEVMRWFTLGFKENKNFSTFHDYIICILNTCIKSWRSTLSLSLPSVRRLTGELQATPFTWRASIIRGSSESVTWCSGDPGSSWSGCWDRRWEHRSSCSGHDWTSTSCSWPLQSISISILHQVS